MVTLVGFSGTTALLSSLDPTLRRCGEAASCCSGREPPVIFASGVTGPDMNDPNHSFMPTLLCGAAWLMLAMAGLLFFFGGSVISAFAKTDRILGEMIAIGIALVCGSVGALFQAGPKPVEEHDASTSR